MDHGIEVYDVCQILRNGEWLDYSTIKDEEDYRYAIRLCDGESFGGHPVAKYRIASSAWTVNAKYPQYSFTTDRGVTHTLKAKSDWLAILEAFTIPAICGHVRFGPHSLAATSYGPNGNGNRMIELA